MLNSKKIFSGLLFASVLSVGCMEQKIIFDFNKDVNQSFFRQIPGLGDTIFIKFPVTKQATKAQVYVSSFRERFIENDDLLEYTELNDNSKTPAADYWYVNGYSQDLYLIKYDFNYTIKSKNGNLLETPAEGVVFFSVKYNGRGNTLGVTPCYFGIIDEDENLISFNTELALKKEKSSYYLRLLPNEKNMNGLLFMPAAFPANPKTADDKFNIEKIVKLDPNKVGGYKPLIFDISKIFNDSNALAFHYVGMINLTR